MTKRKGRIISSGYAIGNVWVLEKSRRRAPHKSVTDTSAELARYEKVKNQAITELKKLSDKVMRKEGAESAEIFIAQATILMDEDYNSRIVDGIEKEGKNAEWAVSDSSRYFYDFFKNIKDEQINAKADDIRDVANRLLKRLMGDKSIAAPDEPSIIVAKEITPSELMQIGKNKILAIVSKEGSAYSHVAILAKTLGIPVVMGISLPASINGKKCIVDGYNGIVFTDPDDAAITEYRNLIGEEAKEKVRLGELVGKESVTRDGRRISLYANISGIDDIEEVLKNDAEGVGLLRTEFMFLDRDTLPTQEEHYRAYRSIVEKLKGKELVVRTLDLGADKRIPALPDINETNPALGTRAIRMCFKNPEMFMDQLKGVLMAAAYGKISIMFPMITSVKEVKQILKMLETAKEELGRDGISYGLVKVGIMIETPAAALISDQLAPMVDFISIGTNDLTQYTLALDRMSSELVDFYNPYHEAVLRLLEVTVVNAKKAGIRVGICGELASDPKMTEEFLNMGIDELSVSPKFILGVRRRVREI